MLATMVSVLFCTVAGRSREYAPFMAIMIRMRTAVVWACAAIVFCPLGAASQDLSRYRDAVFGSTVTSVAAVTRTGPDAVKVVHQRPSLIQELRWRPQYALGRPAGSIDPVQEVTFRFYEDQLFAITVVYEARLVDGMTNADIIEAVSAVYGPATLTAAASRGPALAPAGAINASTAIATWHSDAHEFTLMREVYPATFRLLGVSKTFEPLARAAETEVGAARQTGCTATRGGAGAGGGRSQSGGAGQDAHHQQDRVQTLRTVP